MHFGGLNIGKYHMHACIRTPMQEYYWWIKYWRLVANRQNLLLANISSYMESEIKYRHVSKYFKTNKTIN